jgi:hypothetical protein
MWASESGKASMQVIIRLREISRVILTVPEETMTNLQVKKVKRKKKRMRNRSREKTKGKIRNHKKLRRPLKVMKGWNRKILEVVALAKNA